MTGRPSSFSAETADRICAGLAEGKSLRRLCREEWAPDISTVFRWLADKDNAVFREQYARAREACADALVEEIIDIADETSGDFRTNADGLEIPDHEHIQRSRLRVDARKWYASKVAPKKYGDKLTQEISGPDGGAVVTRIERVIVDPKT